MAHDLSDSNNEVLRELAKGEINTCNEEEFKKLRERANELVDELAEENPPKSIEVESQ